MQALRLRTIARPIYQLRATMSTAIQPNEPLEQSKIPQQPSTEEVTPKRLANLHFEHYVNTRHWKQSDEFWKRMIQRSRNTLPPYIRGDPESIYEIFLDFNATDYKMFQINEKGGSCLPLPADQGDYRGYTNGFGLSNLRLINRSYFRGQKLLKDPRYNQLKAFALDIGYYGPAYSGMQSQGKSIDPKTNKPYVTVESDLKVLFFKQAMTSAGRTDSGVHALSQVIHYLTSEVNITSEEVLQRFRDGLKTLPEERLFAYDCQQVPKRFHPRSSALWRRYIFNFPLTRNPNPDDNHHSRSTDSSMNTHNHTNYVDFLKLDKILSQLQCKTLPFFTFSSNLDPRGQGLGDKCTIYIAKVQLIDLQTEKVIDPRSIHADGILSDNTSQPLAISIELVASRFVRKMIRILLGTALRECWFTAPNDQTNDMIKPPSDKPFNENVLIDLCHAENRGLTAYPLPSTGLAMAGVGYDPYDLSFCKFMPKNHCSFLNEQNERDFKKFNETNEYCISIKNSTFASNVTDYRQGKYIKLHRERSNYYRRLNETDYRNNSTSNGDRNSSKRNDSTDNRRRE